MPRAQPAITPPSAGSKPRGDFGIGNVNTQGAVRHS